MRRARACVDLILGDLFVRGVAGLQNVEYATHVAACEAEEGGFAVGGDGGAGGGPMSAIALVETHEKREAQRVPSNYTAGKEHYSPLRHNHQVHPPLHLLDRQGREAEPRTPTLDGRRDLANIVADDAEADVARVLLDDATESGLGSLGHHVGLVEDDELERWEE